MTEKESIARGNSDDDDISSDTRTMRDCLRCQLHWLQTRWSDEMRVQPAMDTLTHANSLMQIQDLFLHFVIASVAVEQ